MDKSSYLLYSRVIGTVGQDFKYPIPPDCCKILSIVYLPVYHLVKHFRQITAGLSPLPFAAEL